MVQYCQRPDEDQSAWEMFSIKCPSMLLIVITSNHAIDVIYRGRDPQSGMKVKYPLMSVLTITGLIQSVRLSPGSSIVSFHLASKQHGIRQDWPEQKGDNFLTAIYAASSQENKQRPASKSCNKLEIHTIMSTWDGRFLNFILSSATVLTATFLPDITLGVSGVKDNCSNDNKTAYGT